jgi:uncharacterized membrane protein (DUF4010 family)
MDVSEIYLALATALGLGLLVGLQREWKDSEIAGIRTFPLITLLGTLSVVTTGGRVGVLSASGLVALALALVMTNAAKLRSRKFDFGLTTEVAVLLMYVVGCAVGLGLYGPAVVVTGVTAVLLHWKGPLHRLVDSLTDQDLRATMNLALIGLVILPVLPDETFGPYDVLNPYSIWRMVVLIVGISMAAYVAYKLVGAGAGALLGGIFGGLISSTAVTVSYARQTKNAPDLSAMAAMVVLIASTIVNVRVLVEIGVVAPALLRHALPPLSALLLLMAVECVVLYIPLRRQTAAPPEHKNPAQLMPAIIFGGLYAVVLFVVAAAKDIFGSEALYWIAGVSGLTDVDAITLSTAKMFNEGRVNADTAWRVVLIAAMSNLVFKAVAVAVLGSRRLAFYTAITFAVALLGGVLLLMFWPTGGICIGGALFSPEVAPQ